MVEVDLDAERKVGLYVEIPLEIRRWLRKYALQKRKSIRQIVRELIGNLMIESGKTEGRENAESYRDLMRHYLKLVKEAEMFERTLKRRRTYNELIKFAASTGLDMENLSNLDEITPIIMQKWEGARDDIILFTSLLDINRRKKHIERCVTEEIMKKNVQNLAAWSRKDP